MFNKKKAFWPSHLSEGAIQFFYNFNPKYTLRVWKRLKP